MHLKIILITGAFAASAVWWLLSSLDEWLKDRHAVRELNRAFEEFTKYHRYDEHSQRWVENGAGEKRPF